MTGKLAVWRNGLGDERIGNGHVHIWYVDLSAADTCVPTPESVLSLDERARAARVVQGENRRRFVVSRAVLRCLLSQYAEVAPEQLRFDYGPHGKPELASTGLAPGLGFNMSHSGDVILYAVARGRSIGIDVEHERPRSNFMRIAERFFSVEEYEALHAFPDRDRPSAFFRCWTRKEAYVKARGDGIAAGLDTFSVSMDEEPCLLRSDEGPAEVARWSMADIVVEDGYVSTLCAEGRELIVSHFVWSAC
ncbi:MAG: 4'-phosphopantetheinyl transferase superfamily protein [Candidatus Latescibacterota bacterium]|nr:4'-phosphopantetheinyl transferase superfamily protein [Candidatus Latescibacterota bacterium]